MEPNGIVSYGRDGVVNPIGQYEKPVLLPTLDQKDPCIVGWADARFAIDIMCEHAFFFALLMPPEVAAAERSEALRFHQTFLELGQRIDIAGVPAASDLKSFSEHLVEQIKPFIDYKHRMGEAQTTGKLRSLVWPLFFDHTRREAERWSARLMQISRSESEFDRKEVATFWTEIMDDHAQFMAHLLDPTERQLVDTCFATSHLFSELHNTCVVDASQCTGEPESATILSAAESILEFKTQAVRGIEAGRIKSIIDPRLADHVRREAVKFISELKRAV